MSNLDLFKNKKSSSDDTINYKQLYEEEVLKNKNNASIIESLKKENETLSSFNSNLQKINEDITKKIDDNTSLIQSLNNQNQKLSKSINSSIELNNSFSKKIDDIINLINNSKDNNQLDNIKQSLNSINEKFTSLEKDNKSRTDEVLFKLDYNKTQTEQSFDSNIDVLTDIISKKIDNINESVDEKLISFEDNNKAMNDELISKMEHSQTQTEQSLNSINEKFTSLEKDNKSMTTELISKLDYNKTQIEQLFDSNIDILIDLVNQIDSNTTYEFKLLNSNIDILIDLVNQIDSNNTYEFKLLNSRINYYDRYVSKSYSFIKELEYAFIFKDTIIDSKWLKNKTFSLNNGASNYSFMYVLYRILNEIKPHNILECGLGQSTKLTSQYANSDKSTNLTVVEDSKDWIDTFTPNLNITNNISFINPQLEEFEYKDTQDNIRYKNLEEQLPDTKFDLVIIDGPRGYKEDGSLQDYPRSNIWNLLDYLNDEFIIILDDYDRKGEQNTLEELSLLLDKKGIDHEKIVFRAAKHQGVLCTQKYNFVLWM